MDVDILTVGNFDVNKRTQYHFYSFCCQKSASCTVAGSIDLTDETFCLMLGKVNQCKNNAGCSGTELALDILDKKLG
jgi:hypothetical protein